MLPRLPDELWTRIFRHNKIRHLEVQLAYIWEREIKFRFSRDSVGVRNGKHKVVVWGFGESYSYIWNDMTRIWWRSDGSYCYYNYPSKVRCEGPGRKHFYYQHE